MTTKSLVAGAVCNAPQKSKTAKLQKLFGYWFDAFVYNQIWEDPEVDLRALELDSDSRVLTISSGGCNALNYLLSEPRLIVAVDLNRYHIFLLRLKLAALRTLPSHADFFGFFGFGTHAKNPANYSNFVRGELHGEARSFWEAKRSYRRYFSKPPIKYFSQRGLYDHSRNGYFLRFFHRFANLMGLDPAKILKARTRDEQREIFQSEIAPFFDSWFIKLIGKMPVTLFGLGIPPQQYKELTNDLGGKKSIIDLYRERVARLACGFPIQENYFAWQAFGRRYDTDGLRAVPAYLGSENFQTMKSECHKIRTVIGSIIDEIKTNPADSFNRFVFLDAQDWMNEAVLTDLWKTLAEKAEPGSRIIFRTAGAASPVETRVPADVRARFIYHEERSKELFLDDRASIYGGFHLYEKKQ